MKSLFNEATRNGSYAVTVWFNHQKHFQTVAYIKIEHVFNVIHRCVKMKTWCEEDGHLVEWILDELAIQKGWEERFRQLYPKIQNIAIGVEDIALKASIIHVGAYAASIFPNQQIAWLATSSQN